VRSGDTPASARARMTRTPPHILITTPESLYILLTSQGGRRMLSTVRTVIVDEIHAVAGSKRGSHLADQPRTPRRALRARAPMMAPAMARMKRRRRRSRLRRGLDSPADGGALHLESPPAPDPHRPLRHPETHRAHRPPARRHPPPAPHHRQRRPRPPARPRRRSPRRRTRRRRQQRADGASRMIAWPFSSPPTAPRSSSPTPAAWPSASARPRRAPRPRSVAAHHGSLSKATRLTPNSASKPATCACVVATASLELGIDVGDVELVIQTRLPALHRDLRAARRPRAATGSAACPKAASSR
jgi:ATP-dependent Lhr-like helicase